jgi:hypothetical protein
LNETPGDAGRLLSRSAAEANYDRLGDASMANLKNTFREE